MSENLLLNNPIIGFAGHMGSGKTTCAVMVSRSEYPHHIYNFAEGVRDVFECITGISKEHTRTTDDKSKFLSKFNRTIGQMLQDIGEGMRKIYPDIWVIKLEQQWKRDGCPPIVIGDVRYPNEVVWIEKHDGVVVRLLRDSVSENVSETRSTEHESETALDQHKFRYLVDNSFSTNVLWEELMGLKIV